MHIVWSDTDCAFNHKLNDMLHRRFAPLYDEILLASIFFGSDRTTAMIKTGLEREDERKNSSCNISKNEIDIFVVPIVYTLHTHLK